MEDEIIKKKVKVQKNALKAWINAGKIGSIQIITGLGKTKLSLDAVKLLPTSAKIVFLAEQTDRERELRKEQKKWGVENYEIEFACYQTAYKWVGRKFDLVIADEGVDSFTSEYSKFYFNNKFKELMCLFAYLDKDVIVGQENGKDITKGYLCNKIAPVCFTYGMEQGQIDKTARALDIYIIKHKLDNVNKNIVAGNKTNQWYQTEQSAYTYADAQFQKIWAMKRNFEDTMVLRASGKRANLLYSLPSKIEATKILLSYLNTPTIVFANSVPALEKISPNVISSYKSDKENDDIRTAFDNGQIDVICSFKKLQQGANLTDLDNVILMSYYSKQKIVIQRTGRLRDNGEVGRVFIFVTMNTQEEKWNKAMFEGIIGLNFIHCDGVQDCVNKLTEKSIINF